MNLPRVLIASHTYTAPFNRAKLDMLARQVNLSAIIPNRWHETLFPLDANRIQSASYALHILSIRANGHILRYIYPFRAIIRIVRSFDPDVIYVEEEPPSLALAQFAVLKHRAKLICFTWENILRRVGVPGIEQFNLKRCDGVIAGNRDAADIIQHKGFCKPITVTPQLGVDPTVFVPHERRAKSEFVIGYIGRLVEEKGICTLLAAIADLPNTSLVLVGAGPMRDEILQRISERALEDRVQVIPAVPHQDIPSLLPAFDVLVLPSHTTPTWKEQFGHVLIEAMACGVPVIGSNSGAIPESIGDAGIIVPERDAHALRAAIANLIAEPTHRAELSHAGRARVLEHFTHERIAQANLKFFRQVLAS